MSAYAQRLAIRCEVDALRCPVKQANSEHIFEGPHDVGDGGLR
jgi:hypothetical protein